MDIEALLNNPAMQHAIAVHFPIALIVLGVPVTLLAAVFNRFRALTVVACAMYGLAIGGSFAASYTGNEAMELVPSTASAEVWELIEEHEELGKLVWVGAAATLTLLLLGLGSGAIERFQGFRAVLLLVAFLVSSGAAGLTGIAAHHGGSLVYDYGVGTAIFDAEQPPASVTGEAAEEAESALVPIRDLDAVAAEAIGYVRDVQPIFDRYCISCHEGDDPAGAYDMTSVERMMLAGNKAGPGIVPGDPDASSIVEYIRGIRQPRMPKRKPPLSEEDLHTIRLWILAGAIDDSTAVPAAATSEAIAPPQATETDGFDPFGAAPAEGMPSDMDEPDAAQTAPIAPESDGFDPFA